MYCLVWVTGLKAVQKEKLVLTTGRRRKMRFINLIVIHCADTYARMDIGRKEIDAWHKERGWAGIGYHYVIRRDGTIEPGRPEEQPGAHVTGHNSHSIGICYAGGKGADGKPEDNRTYEQRSALLLLVKELKRKYPEARVAGHRDLNPGKACPCFDVKKEFGVMG